MAIFILIKGKLGLSSTFDMRFDACCTSDTIFSISIITVIIAIFLFLNARSAAYAPSFNV
jgi:hypothetical protein